VELWRDLERIKAERLWMLEYATWGDFCLAVLGVSGRYVRRLVQAYEIWRRLSLDPRASHMLPMLKATHILEPILKTGR
jgi:hypothetical protein